MRMGRWIVRGVRIGAPIAAILIVCLWLSSLYRNHVFQYFDKQWVEVRGGYVLIGFDESGVRMPEQPLYSIQQFAFPTEWWFVVVNTPTRKVVQVPLWSVLLIALACSAIAWWPKCVALSRRLGGRCICCGYSRAGLAPEATCPECGPTKPASASTVNKSKPG